MLFQDLLTMASQVNCRAPAPHKMGQSGLKCTQNRPQKASHKNKTKSQPTTLIIRVQPPEHYPSHYMTYCWLGEQRIYISAENISVILAHLLVCSIKVTFASHGLYVYVCLTYCFLLFLFTSVMNTIQWLMTISDSHSDDDSYYSIFFNCTWIIY